MSLIDRQRSRALTVSAVLLVAAAGLVTAMTLPGLLDKGTAWVLAAPSCSQAHVVARGETLALIAQRYGLTVSRLAEENSLRNYDYIYIGQTLCLPSPQTTASPQPSTSICVEGHMVGEQHMGLGGFTVIAQTPGMDSLHTVTDESGSFRFDGLSPGLWTFSQELPQGWKPVTAATLHIQLEYSRDGCFQISFENQRELAVGCLLVYKVDETTGAPLQGWEVQIRRRPEGPVLSSMTDDDGQIRFDGLEPGTWEVQEIAARPWQPADGASGTALVELLPVVEENDCAELVLQSARDPAGCVEGFSIDEQHRPFAGSTVCASPSDAAELTLCKVTDESGYFWFEDLALGEWVLWEELEPGWTAITAQRFPVLVDETEGCELVRFKNRPPDLCAQGYVLDDEGVGLAGSTITAWPKEHPHSSLSTTVEADGQYRICGLTLGAWVFRQELQMGWKALDGQEQEISVAYPGPDMDVEAPLFRSVPPRGCIEGWKVDEFDVGLPLWNITVERTHTGEVWQRQTDGTGYFQVCGLPMGNYLVWQEEQVGWQPVTPPSLDVTLEPSDEEVISIVVFVDRQLERGYCIDGYAQDALNGEGVASWEIAVSDTAGNLLDSTTTDETGYYRLTDLEPGTYLVEETVEEGWWPTSGTTRSVTVDFPPSYDCVEAVFTNAQRTADAPCLTWHVVSKNETLAIISRRYGVYMSAIMAVNGLVNPDFIWVGQGLCIPGP